MKKFLYVLLILSIATTKGISQEIDKTLKIDSCNRQIPIMERTEKSKTKIQLKSNLLYDAILIPNLSSEINMGKNWSIEIGFWYTWLKKDHKHRYWRSYGEEIDIRKYISHVKNENVFRGHHIGAVFMSGIYDTEFGNKGEKSNFSYATGIEYGYSTTISSKINIDISLALGYWGGRYEEYKPIDTHYVWQSTKNRNWFGPIKASINLSYKISKKGCR